MAAWVAFTMPSALLLVAFALAMHQGRREHDELSAEIDSLKRRRRSAAAMTRTLGATNTR